MDATGKSHMYLFDDFGLDRRRGGLFRWDDAGMPVPVSIGWRALDCYRCWLKTTANSSHGTGSCRPSGREPWSRRTILRSRSPHCGVSWIRGVTGAKLHSDRAWARLSLRRERDRTNG